MGAPEIPRSRGHLWEMVTYRISERKQPSFHDNTTTSFPTRWSLRNECRNSILMTTLPRWNWCFWLVEAILLHCTSNEEHYPDLGSVTLLVWISAFVPQMSFHGEILLRSLKKSWVTMCFSLIVVIIKLLEIGTWDNTYSATGKTVNTWNISGMFIVLWPITAKTRKCKLATKPQTN